MHPSFDLKLDGVGWFGTGIAFMKVRGSIADLHWVVLRAVERLVVGDRFEYDGDGFEPHLTLAAEFAGATPGQLAELAEKFDGRSYEFRVTSVAEFRRTSRGDIYRPVSSFSLADNAL